MSLGLTRGDLVISVFIGCLAFFVAYWFIEAGMAVALLSFVLGVFVGGIRAYLARRTFNRRR